MIGVISRVECNIQTLLALTNDIIMVKYYPAFYLTDD